LLGDDRPNCALSALGLRLEPLDLQLKVPHLSQGILQSFDAVFVLAELSFAKEVDRRTEAAGRNARIMDRIARRPRVEVPFVLADVRQAGRKQQCACF
jgi:hypothetical protein